MAENSIGPIEELPFATRPLRDGSITAGWTMRFGTKSSAIEGMYG